MPVPGARLRSSWTTALALLLPLAFACGGGGENEPVPPPVVTTVSIVVDAGSVAGTLSPLWGDHYDLSYTHLGYAGEPGFLPLAQSLQPRSWRCSIGRWEVSMPPPPGGDSTNPSVLQTVEREFYRGPNTLAGADDRANYDFSYLDAQLSAIAQTGAEPFLCFDYMPFVLSSEQDPLNPDNIGLGDPRLSFSNGIRTAPPGDPAVYARVVRNTVRHVRGQFGGNLDYGITYIEIGNEPDLLDGAGAPIRYFWTGTRQDWIVMYAFIAAEIDGDPGISGLVKLGGGSFAFFNSERDPTFLQDFLVDVALNARRLDFVSYHSYGDDFGYHFVALSRLQGILGALGITPEIINGEWGRALDGADPVYDRIEHGLFRAKVMMLMQLFGVSLAHEALFRDVTPGQDQLGLIYTGPPATKPVSDVYLALNKLNGTLQALPISAPPGTFQMAGSDPSGARVVLVYVGDDPGSGNQTEVDLAVTNLPWGAGTYDANRYEVSEATGSAGLGVHLVDARTGLPGPTFIDTPRFGPGPGAGQIILWELIKNP